jgi:hypothetical protein
VDMSVPPAVPGPRSEYWAPSSCRIRRAAEALAVAASLAESLRRLESSAVVEHRPDLSLCTAQQLAARSYDERSFGDAPRRRAVVSKGVALGDDDETRHGWLESEMR